MMAKSKFTPGPWGFQESEVYKNTWRITAGGQRLASLDSDDGDPAQTQANAELMADAPSMLEVLRAIRDPENEIELYAAMVVVDALLEKHGG
jgi:hypothetical protein